MRTHTSLALVAVLALVGCQGTSDSPGGGAAAKNNGGRSSGSSGNSGGILSRFRAQPIVVPEGTNLPLVLEAGLSSAASRAGDPVTAKVTEDVRVGDKVAIPRGSEARGQVTAAVPSGKVKGNAHLAFDFDHVVVNGKEVAIEAHAVEITAPTRHKRDAEIIGGGTAGGALIGALVGGKKGAGIGALIGAGGGTGVVLTNTGGEVTVPAGSRVNVKLTREAKI